MAKKLNKKVAIIGIVLLVLVVGVVLGLLIGPAVARKLGIFQNPDKALAKAHQLRDAGDYENAAKEFGRAYAFGKTDEYKIVRLFEMAQFHLIHNDRHEANWVEALKCWNTVVKIDPKNVEAMQKLLDFYYQAADAGDARLWKNVNEYATKLLDSLKEQGAEPDAFLSIAHAKSLLGMAQQEGESANRRELLAQGLQAMDALLGQHPENEELYLLRAQADLLQGELDQLDGVQDAQAKAMENAIGRLETGTAQAQDKAAATANLLTFKLQTTANDPNSVEKIRAEIETQTKNFPPNDKLLLVMSIAYETSGTMSPQAELNRAIEALRQAHELSPENIEYRIRMYRLLYRKGSAFNDPDAVADATELAESVLSLPQAQDIPGPLQGRSLSYRFLTNSFLAEIYLEKALHANNVMDAAAAKEWIQKAQPRIEEISNYIRTAENPIVRKFQGMLALAQGDQDKAVRLMYSAYEQSKALDKERQRSGIDPVLCVTLADIMKEKGERGMQREFLEKALSNSNPIVLRKPDLILDYAENLAQLRLPQVWPTVLTVVNNYQSRYGSNLRSQILKTNALMASSINELDQAQQALSEIPASEPAALQLKIGLLTSRMNRIQLAASQQDAENQEPTTEQTQELTALRQERSQALRQLLDLDTELLDIQTLTVVCNDLIINNQTQTAVALMDKYLSKDPDNITLKVLKLQTLEENPLEVPAERLKELQVQALNTLEDPLKKYIGLSQLYRNHSDYENARKAIQEIPQTQAENPQVLLEKFELAIQQEDIQTAENLLRPLRSQNADQCEGNLFSAQVEFLKKNYSLALRRLDEALAIQPLSSRIYFLKGRIYNQQEEYEPAIENLRMADRMNPLNAMYARSLASVLFARNTKLASKVTPQQQQEAQRALEIAMVLNPADWQLQSVYAEAISSSNPDNALAIRQRLLKNYPSTANALMLGNMAMRIARSEWDAAKKTGLVELAGSAYQQAVQMEPANETAQQSYADYLRMAGKSEQAVEYLKDDQNLLWKYYLRNSQFEQAKEILDELFQKNPREPLVVQGLALAMGGMGNRTEVKRYLDLFAELDDSRESQLWLLQKYLDNGFMTEVEGKLAGFKERFPEENLVLLIEAWIQMGKGQLEGALSLTNRYLEINAENAGAWRLRGRLHRLMNQPQKAVSDLERSKRILPDAMVRLELASVYNEIANPQAAVGELNEGLNDPQSPLQLRLMLEAIYQKINNIAELEKFYQSTLEKYPESFFWYYRVGNFYLQQKNFSKAQEYLLKSWDLSRQQKILDFNVLTACLEVLYQTGRYEPTFSVASELIDSPGAPVAYAYMALAQLKLNQPQQKAAESFDKALQKAESDWMQEFVLQKMLDTVGRQAVESWYNQQLSQDPKSIQARLLAWRLAQQEGNYNKAVEHLDQCIESLGSDHPGLTSLTVKKGNTLIMAYAKTSDKDYLGRAIVLFKTLIEKHPENPALLNNLAYLLADNDKEIETALEYARKASQSDPGNTVYLDTYGYALCKTGRYDEAEQRLLRAFQINEASFVSNAWDMYKHMGMIYEGQGRNPEAVNAYQKALNASTEIPEKEKQQLQQKLDDLKQQTPD